MFNPSYLQLRGEEQLLLLPTPGNNTAWLFLQAIHVNSRMHQDNTPACCCHASAAARTSLHTTVVFPQNEDIER